MNKLKLTKQLSIFCGMAFIAVFSIFMISATEVASEDAKVEVEERSAEDFGPEPFIGEIVLFAGNYAPRGWAFCHGQMMSPSEYSALFSILGTMYGGDGRTSFALPDLRSRTPVGAGTGPGLTRINPGQKRGAEGVSAGTNNISAPQLGMNYIIALDGIYPSRN